MRQFTLLTIFTSTLLFNGCTLAVATSSGQPKHEVNFDYNNVNKLLQITGQLCKSGKKNKRKLPSLALGKVHQYVLTDRSGFIEQIKSVSNGMMSNRLTIAELSVIYDLDIERMKFNYSFEGNQVCTDYKAALTLDFDASFAQHIQLLPEGNSFFMAAPKNTGEVTQIISRITADDITTTDLANTHSLKQLRAYTDNATLYQFNYAGFLADKLEIVKRVHVSGDSELISLLNDYLKSEAYRLVEKTQAHWFVTIVPDTSHPTSDFSITLNNGDSAIELNSRDFTLPFTLNMNNALQRRQAHTLKLELMELTTKMSRDK